MQNLESVSSSMERETGKRGTKMFELKTSKRGMIKAKLDSSVDSKLKRAYLNPPLESANRSSNTSGRTTAFNVQPAAILTSNTKGRTTDQSCDRCNTFKE